MARAASSRKPRGPHAAAAPADESTATENPDELVDVVDAQGNRARVGRAWLEQWPEDFRLASENAPTGEPAPIPAQDNPEPSPAQDQTGSMAEPDKEKQ